MSLKDELNLLLRAHGHDDICEALSNNTTPNLSDDRKNVLTEAAAKVRSANKPAVTSIHNALVVVSTSGWSKEADWTLPGKIIPGSDRRA